MSRLINTTTMTVDGVTDVGEWYVSEGEHDRAAREQFVGAAGMVVGRTTFEGLAAYWTQQTGEWAARLNALPKFVALDSKSFDSGVALLRYEPVR